MDQHTLSGYFSPDYQTARKRFEAGSHRTGARFIRLPLDVFAPDGIRLSIDIAWLGNPEPRRVLLHVCGIHGVEGFCGSAIQLRLLESPPALAQEDALILVHPLNPYGMAWLRRYNESNVDMNRNVLKSDDAYRGVSETYRELYPLLNPSALSSLDLFYCHAVPEIWKRGFQTVKESLVQGQYEFPQGLFFGGDKLTQGMSVYRDWLNRNLSSTRDFFVIDVHSGLGQFGEELLFVERRTSSFELLRERLGDSELIEDKNRSVGYSIRGGHDELFDCLEFTPRVNFVVQEFGTYHPLRVLKALRDENVFHHHSGRSSDTFHPVKQRLRKMFCPESLRWRCEVLAKGTRLVHCVAVMW